MQRPANPYGLRLRVGVLLFVLVAVLCVATVCSTAYGASVNDFTASDSAVVSLTIEELDSLILEYDMLDRDFQLLKVNLWEVRAYGQLDSIRIHALTEHLRQELQQRWWKRIIYNPALWFAFGVYVGVNAYGGDN